MNAKILNIIAAMQAIGTDIKTLVHSSAVLIGGNTFNGDQVFEDKIKMSGTANIIEMTADGKVWNIVNGSDVFTLRENNTSGTSTRFRINAGGNIGIGAINPNKKLDVDGTAGYYQTGKEGTSELDFASRGYVDSKVIIAKATVDEQDVNNNQVLAVSNELNQTGWSFDDTAKSYTYTGSPIFVEITGHVSQRIDDATNGQRPAPGLKLQKNISGTRTDIAQAYTGYIRDISDHENSSNSIPSYIDASPGVNPEYRLYCEQETTNGSVVTSLMGHFVLKANN